MPKVTVIVPVFGVEKYIERCARSLFEQTIDDIEYVFVDDCTPDKSMDILKNVLSEYPSRLPQVKFAKMPVNSGQAAVRREGLRFATGDYIIYCDSDDWVDRDMYRQMYEKALEDDADMTVCDFVTHDGEKILSVNEGCQSTEHLRFLKDMMFQNKSWSVCNKLVRSSLYKKLEYYPTGAMGEDMVITMQLAFNSQRISHVSNTLYYYFSNPSSITNSFSADAAIKKFNQYYGNFQLVESFFNGKLNAREFKRALNWIRYSIKTMLYFPDKNVRRKRRSVYRFVEFKVLFYKEVNAERKKMVLKYMLKSLINRR